MRLGVVGTMVWDRIYSRDVRREPFEEWGGISYALAALQAVAPSDWRIAPLIKVGRDVREQAFEYFRTLPNLDIDEGILLTDVPNNRVALHYHDAQRRCERLSGGVPPWTWEEIAPLLRNVDALYVNFISGSEMELETARRLRTGFAGPIYADLHSLMLGMDEHGMRVPRPIPEWREWIHCFDIVQVNEDELGLLAHYWGDPWRFAAEVVGDELRLLLVTLADRGAAYVQAPSFQGNPLTWRHDTLAPNKKLTKPGSTKSEKIPAVIPSPSTSTSPSNIEMDPTGCGDVWGATMFTRLLMGDDVKTAMIEANKIASRNVQHRGASGLHHFLNGRIAQ